jgi:hypothetical protein
VLSVIALKRPACFTAKTGAPSAKGAMWVLA